MVTLFSCLGKIVSYSMPQGDKRGATYEFYDWNYDGEWRGDNLSNGLGALTDSNLGPADYKLGYYAKSESSEDLELIRPIVNMFYCFRSRMGWLEER